MWLLKLVHRNIERQFPEVVPSVARGFDEGAQGDDVLGGAQAPAHAPVAHPVLDDQASGRFRHPAGDGVVPPQPLRIVHPGKIVAETGD